ncbi:hypothetical protein AB0Q95_05260 [Streptomyces sp. NPDC059900]|uniref:hypothetical protein n=1 Tax=Streptomyces sp. NPDC059900 TaxID=3155816 RepID=UPI003440B892
MAYEPDSRYHGLETAHLVVRDADGTRRTIAYTRRRVIPSYEEQPTLAVHRVSAGERLDVLTARYAGDPTLYWMICDANAVLDPAELEAVGRVVRIAMARG